MATSLGSRGWRKSRQWSISSAASLICGSAGLSYFLLLLLRPDIAIRLF